MNEDFEIVYEYGETDDPYKLTPEETEDAEQLQEYLENNPKQKNARKRLKEMVKKHPDTPYFQYCQVKYLKASDEEEQAFEKCKALFEAYPDYLPNRLELAKFALSQKRENDFRELMGEDFNLPSVLPDRKKIDVDDYLKYCETVFFYYSSRDDGENASLWLTKMEDTEEDSEIFLTCSRLYRDYLLLKENYLASELLKRELHHPEINLLFERDLDLTREEIDNILALPRKTLVEDLKLLLKNAVNRYDFILQRDELGMLEEEETYYPLHALFFLAQLEAEEAFDQILEFLKQDSDFIEYWLMDVVFEDIDAVLVKCGMQPDDFLLDILTNNAIAHQSRICINMGLALYAYWNPNERQEVAQFFKKEIAALDHAIKEDEDFDESIVGALAGDLADLNMTELMPDMETLVEHHPTANDHIEDMIGGISEMAREHPIIPFKDGFDIFDTYKKYRRLIEPNDEMDETHPQSPLVKPRFPGRNDPCHCGSGKKYKKCCLRKDEETGLV